MKYCVKSQKLIFGQYGDNLWGVSSQIHDITKCCKCCISSLQFREEVKGKIMIKVLGKCYVCDDYVIKSNIIIFYITKKPDVPLYVPIENKSICVQTPKNSIVARSLGTTPAIPTNNKIDNSATGSGYSLELKLASNKQPVFLLIDTGSSTMAAPLKGKIQPNDFALNPLPAYEPNGETKTTEDAQFEQYGAGELGGAFVRDNVWVEEEDYVNLYEGNFCCGNYALSFESPLCNGGILGMAFTSLNYGGSYGKTSYPEIAEKYSCCGCINCSTTCSQDKQDFWNNFNQLSDYPTFMDYVGSAYGTYAQKFGLNTTRTYRNIVDESENLGDMVLFGGEEYTNYYDGTLVEIPLQNLGVSGIIADYQYYQVELKKITFNIGSKSFVIDMPELVPDNFPCPNIIDSGTSELDLVIPSITGLREFLETNISFVRENGFEAIFNSEDIYSTNTSNIILSEWPDVIFTLMGKNREYDFVVSPKNYWQNDYIQEGQTSLAMTIQDTTQAGENANAIMGLTFICQNYCVFDYANKLVKIAPRKV